jgi:uncharacterized delta-60 repeat protein
MRPRVTAIARATILLLAGTALVLAVIGPARGAAGDLDTTFGYQGTVVTEIGPIAYANGLVLQPDGKIVLGGYSFHGREVDFTLARYNRDGSLDAGFGSGGIVTSLLGEGGDAWALARQPDGKLLLGGDV